MNWESKFRQLRKESYRNELSFLDTIFNKEAFLEVKNKEIVSKRLSTNTHKENFNKPPINEELTEKAKTFQDLKEFVEDKIDQKDGVFEFKEGKITPTNIKTSSKQEVCKRLLEDAESIQVLFVYGVSEENLALSKEERANTPSEQLLSRMILAMKLDENQYKVLGLEGNKEESFLNELSSVRPQVIVPMGAVATNILLGKEERISHVHGKSFNKEFIFSNGTSSVEIIPVFGPEMILINPNMKRSTWNDLQKVMEKVKS